MRSICASFEGDISTALPSRRFRLLDLDVRI